jgi:ParB family chromosome partitioning protein
MMDPRIIQIEKAFNPRDYRLKENREHLDELKASIKMRGVLQPLLVRFDPQQQCAILNDGECRLRAVLELIEEGVEIATIPILQVQGGNETERLVIALTANTGKPLSKWESGTAFKRLANFGWSSERIAAEIGYSERYVKEAIELTDAPEEVKHLLQAQVRDGNVHLSGRGRLALLDDGMSAVPATAERGPRHDPYQPSAPAGLAWHAA